jgi:hypothetical protein
MDEELKSMQENSHQQALLASIYIEQAEKVIKTSYQEYV